MNGKIRFLFSLVCLSILLVFPTETNGQDYALSCGATEASVDADKKKWEPDTKFLKTANTINAPATYQDPSLLSTVPYMTARIFNAPAKYEIPVKGTQRHLVRLHFYPSTYTSLDISNSYFAVAVNDVTLLSNFSAAITCQALTQAYLVKEYSLAPTEKDVMTITFTPSDKHRESFAFINGIEVIQMPELFDTAVLVGFTDQTTDAKAANLQLMFRLNVGGQDIPGSQDSGGLTRTWYNDAPYIFSAGLGVTLQASNNFKINYQKMPVSTAPADVYKTARTQGPDGNINMKSNLTWTFQVDTNFTYIMRLHFCEFQLAKANQKTFNIYINNRTAQADANAADIISWTGEKGVPVYKDYAIYVDASTGGEEISLQMTPSNFNKPEYLDSQLNGLEIFKMETMKNLAGPNPQPSPMQANEEVRKEFKSGTKTAFIIASAGGVATVLFVALCFSVYSKKRGYQGSDSHTSSWLPIYGNSTTSGTKSTISGKSNNGSHLSNLAAGLCRRFTLPEIRHGTQNFDDSNVIGVGGFGKVYKGIIDGTTKVAIKRSNPNSEQGLNEFETEIELLSRLRHKHLVSLIGYCDDGGEMCLLNPSFSTASGSTMSSMNFNPFQNWFEKPPNPVPSINFVSVADSFTHKSQSPNFASIGLPKFLKKSPKPEPENNEPGKFKKIGEQFIWECENIPDHRHTPEVDKILNEDPVFEKKENPSPEEVEAEEKWWERFRASPVVQFMTRAEEIADDMNKMELEENDTPYRKEDKDLWRAVPHVIGLDGRPMPRHAIKSKEESDDKFWDFMKQFLFGLWGFRQRPYPPGRPIDVAQAIGYKKLEQRYYDFIMKSGGWWYKDRLGRSRGPCELITLKTAYGSGIIDRDTFIWGEDMDEWAPIHMVYGLEPAIATWEVRLGAAATAFLHKLQRGIPPWVPLKGREPKTYNQLQKEAIESKKRDMAVLEANDGVWPGLRTPSHALFLWASGSELTTILESDHMPNKFIPKQLRLELAKVIPGLRPWEVISIEQAMDQISYGGEWYREPLGTYTTGPPYIREWNRNVMRLFRIFYTLSVQVAQKLETTVPGFGSIMEKVQKDYDTRVARRMKRREEELRAKELKHLSGLSDEDDEVEDEDDDESDPK